MKPLLQIALDQSRLDKALEVADIAAPNVDIIEAGTILCLAEGRKAVETLRERYPNHILVADYKTADAGSTLAEIAFDAGADWFTVMCAASLATIEKAHEVAVARGKEVQIELFGNWTLEDAKAWANMGVKQAIYHRSVMRKPADKNGAKKTSTSYANSPLLAWNFPLPAASCRKKSASLKTSMLNASSPDVP